MKTKKPKKNWDDADWSKSDSLLSFKFNCSTAHVTAMRRKLGKPKAVQSGKAWGARRFWGVTRESVPNGQRKEHLNELRYRKASL
jgi:hypothetical protein